MVDRLPVAYCYLILLGPLCRIHAAEPVHGPDALGIRRYGLGSVSEFLSHFASLFRGPGWEWILIEPPSSGCVVR